MTNEEKWANTLEKLHDVKVAPFNSDYDSKRADIFTMQQKFIYKLRKALDKLETKDNLDILNKIDDICYVYACAINNMHGYSIEDGEIKHKTERGQKLADIFNN